MKRKELAYLIMVLACIIMFPILHQKYDGDIFYCMFPIIGIVSGVLSLSIS